jgi:glycosyltransferase involved in cell wall biosynthesis
MSTSPAPQATVVIPYFEASATVRATLDSVLAQSVRDIEVLLVDDGSVREPLPADLPDDPRVHVMRRPQNGGYARVTNEAVARARGEWVTFVDSDDTVAPDYLERLIAAGEAAGADAVFTPMIRVAGGRTIGRGPWNPRSDVLSSADAIRALLHGDLSGTQHLLLRRPAAVSEPDQVYSDTIFTLRNLAHAGDVACVDAELYFNSVRIGSTTGTLRTTVWDLVRLNEVLRPTVESVFAPQEAAELLQAHRDLSLTQILHTAANEREDSPLRAEVTDWCRRRISLRGIADQARRRNYLAAASWSLAKLSGSLHRRAYQAYDSRRKQAV